MEHRRDLRRVDLLLILYSQWEKGLKSGNGVWRGIEGEYYIGEWKESRTHGKGMYVWSNGDKYEGDWRNGLKHGQG